VVIHCARDCCFQNTLVCIYTCPITDKKKCKEYLAKLDEIISNKVPDKYLSKYGEPEFDLPKEPKKRQPKVETEVKPKKRIVRKLGEPEVGIPVEIETKKPRKKRSDSGKAKSSKTEKANVEIDGKKTRRERSDKGQKRGKRK